MQQEIISIIFYITFMLYAFLGVGCLMQNRKAIRNQLFSGVCMGLAVLAFVFAIANALVDADDPIIWQRVVSLGWITTGMLIPVMISAGFVWKRQLFEAAYSGENWSVSDILSERTHTAFIRCVAAVYASVSIMNLCKCFFYPSTLWLDMIHSAAFVIMGIIMFGLTLSGLSTLAKDRILTGVIAVSIPYTLFLFVDLRMSNILWTAPLVYLMITIIFRRIKMFWVISTVTMVSGVVLWLTVNDYSAHVGTLDYFVRLVLYAITIVLAAFINKAYIARLRQTDQQVEFQKMFSDITTHFVTVNGTNYYEKVWDLLKTSGSLINADRAFIGLFSDDLKTVNFANEWLRETIGLNKSLVEKRAEGPYPALTWSTNQLTENDIVYVSSIDKLPPEAAEEQKMMKSLNTRSTIHVPILGRDRIIGFIGFDQIRIRRPWRMDDLELLRVLANVMSDAIKKVETEKEINDLAYFDTLTGLPNRMLFNNRLEKAMALAERSKLYLGVIFIDLDGFKEVNDTLGHNWGDHLLQCIAKRLSGCVRKYDTVARFGGDEFLVMVPQLSRREDLTEIAKKILAVFLQPVIMEDQEVFVNGSCGIAIYPEDGETGSMLIKNADLAMYEAKKNGKGQFVYCSDEMKQSLLKKMYMTNSLYRALEKNELHLHYQPQVSANSQEIVGFEALLRWNHTKLGAISPSEFIPIAEKTGLINSIGEWVLMTACAQNKAWQDAGLEPVQMAVNLSVEQFRTNDLESIVRNCLAETGLDPCYLELEITESIAMKESGDVANCLHKLKDMGVSISIDDFGTEFSSLSRLKDLPVDRIKIDMQFIQGIAVNPKDESIIEVMIHLAKKLGLKVIAEGVETEAQLGFLRDEHCDEIQGYYYFKPLSKDEIEKNGFELLR